MSDKLFESLSALMDDEADDLELPRLLKAMETDDTLGATWSRYHVVQAVLHKQLSAAAAMKVDLTSRVRDALVEEELPIIKNKNKLNVLLDYLPRSAAVAAVVMLSILFTAKMVVNNVPNQTGGGVTANAAPTFNGTSPIQRADYTVGQSTASPQVLRAQRRLNNYVIQHVEQATMQEDRGMLPFVRESPAQPNQQK